MYFQKPSQYSNAAFEGDDSSLTGSAFGNSGRRASSMADIAAAAMEKTQRKSTSASDLTAAVSMDPSSSTITSNPDLAAASRRKSSMADIAMALAGGGGGSTSSLASSTGTSSMKLTKDIFAQYRKNSQRYMHPYGNTTGVMEQLLFGATETEDPQIQVSSPMKLLVWIVFAGFMVGMAGAIILAAGL